MKTFPLCCGFLLVTPAALAGEPCVPEALVTPASSIDIGGRPFFIRTLDINHDAQPDFIVSNTGKGGTTTSGGVGILLGDGEGGFEPLQTVYEGTIVHEIVATDLVADGNTDIAVLLAAWGTGAVDLSCLLAG